MPLSCCEKISRGARGFDAKKIFLKAERQTEAFQTDGTEGLSVTRGPTLKAKDEPGARPRGANEPRGSAGLGLAGGQAELECSLDFALLLKVSFSSRLR